MFLSQVSLATRYTGNGNSEQVAGTTFAEVFNVVDSSGVLVEFSYNAWCLDALTPLAISTNFDFVTYSGNELADGLEPGAIASYNNKPWDGSVSQGNLDLVNWLLNQLVVQITPGDPSLPDTYLANSNLATLVPSLAGVTITMGDVQKAIWQILGQEPFLTASDIQVLGSFDQNRVNALANAAVNNGEGFVADATQIQGIVIVDNFTIPNGPPVPTGEIFQPLFVMTRAAQLGDYVWLDANNNGIQDADESGLGGVSVKLLRDLNNDGTIATDEVVATTSTDATGYYDFKGLVGGVQYQVLVAKPDNYFFTTQDAGSDDTKDSDVNATTGLSQIVTLTAGEFNSSLDAGLVEIPKNPGIDIEKFTNGVDADTLGEAAEVIAGATVTWTYQVTNTGDVDFDITDITVTDDQEGIITNIVSKLNGDDDSILESGETWIYEKTGIAKYLTTSSPGETKHFDFNGSSGLDGQNGNIRTFSLDDLSVKTSAFSRDDSGTWDKVFLGSFSSGLGVTDNSEGNGDNGLHRVDNVGEKNFVLFEFSDTVIVDKVFLNSVVNDSDITYWVGNVAGAFTNQNDLSDSFLSSLELKADDDTNSSSARWADINNGELKGNVLVIAASTSDATPEDRFKIDQLKIKTIQTSGDGFYKNTGTVVAGNVSDEDHSYYVNIDQNPGIDIEKFVNGIDVDNINNLPEIAAGSDVVFTYTVTNTGNVAFTKNQVVVKDDNGTANHIGDDFSPTLVLSSDVNDDGILSAGETWLYASAPEAAQDLGMTSSGKDVQFLFNGSSSTTGNYGNIRTFDTDGVSVDVSAFRNDKGSWSTAYLGLYGGGLGVTNQGEGGSGHRVDNGGSNDYILFEFDKDVVFDKAFLNYVEQDSDISVWIGDRHGADITSLNQSLLDSFSKEDNHGGSSDRWADFNAAGKIGDTLIIAAKIGDSNDSFKLEKLDLSVLGATTIGDYINTVTVEAGGVSDSDTSGYTNPQGAPEPQNLPAFLVAPGTGTPGFWSNQGNVFWDGKVGNESKAGKTGFAEGELIAGQDGLLIGDYNRNGITDNGEDTLFLSRKDALTIVDSSQHKKTNLFDGDKEALKLGRDVVAGWLNYLSGNSFDLASGAKGISGYMDDAINLLQDFQAGGITSNSKSDWWKKDVLGLGISGDDLHDLLDDYNNGSSEFATGNFHRN